MEVMESRQQAANERISGLSAENAALRKIGVDNERTHS